MSILCQDLSVLQGVIVKKSPVFMESYRKKRRVSSGIYLVSRFDKQVGLVPVLPVCRIVFFDDFSFSHLILQLHILSVKYDAGTKSALM